MKVPFIKYIETLVVGRMSPSVIVEELAAVNIEFPLIGISYIVDTLRGTNPEYFEPVVPPATPPVPDSVWLNDIGIEKMYGYKYNVQLPAGTIGVAGAFKIINDPLMYRLITSMALANITAEDIELIVNGKYNIEYSSDDVVCFLHYFFNLKDWTIQDGSGLSDELRRAAYRNPEQFIGNWAKVEGQMEYEASGKLRMPVFKGFRLDKY